MYYELGIMNKKIVKIGAFIFGLAVISAGCAKTPSPAPINETADISLYANKLLVKNIPLNVQVVSSAADMAQGLSDRKSLKEDQGMLFDFKQSTVPDFWMKNMNFNLDLIWISQNKIAAITADVPAPSGNNQKLPVYSPPSPVNLVLEVNAGWAKKNNIAVGDEVKLLP